MKVPNTESRSEMIESLFQQYGNNIYRYVKYSVPDDVDPADVVQEVFVRAFRGWDRFKAHSDPKTWLFSIARNYVYDLLRKKQNERRYIVEQRTGVQDYSTLDSLIELEDVWSQLSLTDQQVLHLRLVQDLSVPDTAKIMNWTEIKVRVTYHRAKKKLRALLTEFNDTSELELKGGKERGAKR